MKLYKFGKNSIRTYKWIKDKGWQLVAWMDRRCGDCGKFISKVSGYDRCKICAKKHHKELSKNWLKRNREWFNEYRRNWRNK